MKTKKAQRSVARIMYEIAPKLRERIVKGVRNPDSFVIVKSAEGAPLDMTTTADLWGQKKIVTALRRAFPRASIVAEESEMGYFCRSGKGQWIFYVDAIDGTNAMVMGTSGRTVMSVAAAKDGALKFALVINIHIGTVYGITAKRIVRSHLMYGYDTTIFDKETHRLNGKTQGGITQFQLQNARMRHRPIFCKFLCDGSHLRFQATSGSQFLQLVEDVEHFLFVAIDGGGHRVDAPWDKAPVVLAHQAMDVVAFRVTDDCIVETGWSFHPEIRPRPDPLIFVKRCKLDRFLRYCEESHVTVRRSGK